PPIRPPEPADRATEHQPPVDPDRLKYRAPDRRGEIALNEILEAQEIVGGAGLPAVGLGLDGPGGDFAIGRALRAAERGGGLIQPAEFAQLGAEHAVVLRQTTWIVALHVNDVAVLNA